MRTPHGSSAIRKKDHYLSKEKSTPDPFGKKNGPSWRTWSFLARDFVGVHVALKQSMKAAESQKQPIAVTHFQHEFNVTNKKDQELQHFLISRTVGEVMEIDRGAS